MHVMETFERSWLDAAAVLAILYGLALVWRGLRGGPAGARGLLRRRIDMLQRMEGFRLTVFGLVLIGVGAAHLWQAQWLLLLSLGIGFVEILESSTLIAVWRRAPVNRDAGRKADRPTVTDAPRRAFLFPDRGVPRSVDRHMAPVWGADQSQLPRGCG